MAIDNVFVLGSGMVLDVRYGFTWFREYQIFDNQGYDLAKFGFPKSYIGQLDPQGIHIMPVRDKKSIGPVPLRGGSPDHQEIT